MIRHNGISVGVVLLVLLVGCASPEPPTRSAPAVSKAEAIRIIEHEDPYSREAIRALRHHLRLEYQARCRRRDEQLAQLDTELLGIDTMRFGKPPRGGPWPEDEFQELLKKQERLRRESQQAESTVPVKAAPSASSPVR